ncbi:sigma-E factor negative regulatory protein RseA [Methylomarinovum caldicuralii]|uniref:Sigma-E factor negative regulatory protein RseA n=1 Tax=Methylomarinovum caldicuralii TaxID=438856 RepID=A0AAU9C7W5_9GAMM|nr:sigma-E factor negative regulatory protein [Methylomarinovum caldicuralii]BCX81516.1 sigma-E factor negative regulatory protein RseA [Methylomarinovum caldicuralii]
MQDDVNWKLSLLMDDELPPDEAIALLDRLHSDPNLQDTWYQYQMIRQAVRQGAGVHANAAFLERIQAALAEEPAPEPPIPQWQGDASSPQPDFLSFWRNPWVTVPMAVAAGVLVAFLWRQPDAPKTPAPVQTAKAVSVPFQADRDARLEDYLLAHSEDSLYLPGAQQMISYARIVSHGGR